MPDLIVNADDFGIALCVSRGIIEGYRKGIVTSTTTMMNMPAAAESLEMALDKAPDLGLGLHLNLTLGHPVSGGQAVPSLVDGDGKFPGAAAFGAVAPGWQVDELAQELRAQMDCFIQITGRPPTHIDSHHHITLTQPAACQIMLDMAAEYDIPVRMIRLADTPAQTASKNWLLRMLPDDLALTYAETLHNLKATHPGYRSTAYFADGFYDKTAILGELLVTLTNLADDGVTELMCHPGYADDEAPDAYWVQRERELDLLKHPNTHEVIVAEKIRLLSYAELPR